MPHLFSRFSLRCTALILVLALLCACSDLLVGKSFTNSIGMEFMLIPAGSFILSAEEGEAPIKVTVSKPFGMGKYEVTQAQWEAVMGNNPSGFKNPTNPVEFVSWKEAQEFIRRLNEKERHRRYRLPTESEWELAARGGTESSYFFLNETHSSEEAERLLDEYAWFAGNSGGKTHPVGQKKPNPYGIYDIYGNVREWVQDYFSLEPVLPANRELRDYSGPAKGRIHMYRGCGWGDAAGNCSSDTRFFYRTSVRQWDGSNGVGFRLACTLR